MWLHADLGEQPCLGHLGFWTQGSEETGLKRPREPSLAMLLPGSWAAPQEAQKEVRRPIRKGKRCRIHSCLQNFSRFGQRFWGARWAVTESGPRAPTDTASPRDTQERLAGKPHSWKLKVGGRVGEGQMTGASLGKIQKHPQTAPLTRDFTQVTGLKATLQKSSRFL